MSAWIIRWTIKRSSNSITPSFLLTLTKISPRVSVSYPWPLEMHPDAWIMDESFFSELWYAEILSISYNLNQNQIRMILSRIGSFTCLISGIAGTQKDNKSHPASNRFNSTAPEHFAKCVFHFENSPLKCKQLVWFIAFLTWNISYRFFTPINMTITIVFLLLLLGRQFSDLWIYGASRERPRRMIIMLRMTYAFVITFRRLRCFGVQTVISTVIFILMLSVSSSCARTLKEIVCDINPQRCTDPKIDAVFKNSSRPRQDTFENHRFPKNHQFQTKIEFSGSRFSRTSKVEELRDPRTGNRVSARWTRINIWTWSDLA